MTSTPLKKCQRPDCGGIVALVADERSDIESEWKCLMCGRSFAVARKKEVISHLQTGYPRQLQLFRAESVNQG